jgi:hypothetical protein
MPKIEHVTLPLFIRHITSVHLTICPVDLKYANRSLRNLQHKFDDDETIAMVDQRSLKVIKDNPIGKGLDGFRASFNVMCGLVKYSLEFPIVSNTR